MSIDRAARDRFASTLSAYMRGEVDNFALDEVAMDRDTEDWTVDRLGQVVWFFYDDAKRHRVSASPADWELMRRVVAFLRSDLELRDEASRFAWLHRGQLWGLAAAGTIAVAGLEAWRGNLLWLLLPGVAVGVPFALFGMRSEARDEPPDNAWYPFESEAHWRTHEHLVARERLPLYDAALHNRPIREPFVAAVIWLPAALFALPIGVLFCLLPRDSREASDE